MLVIDTSVVLKWFFDEQHSVDALALASRRLVAPDLLQVELGHVLTKKVRMKQMLREDARSAFDLATSRVALLPGIVFGRAAFALSLALNHSIYDCYFLAAAQDGDRLLVTADAVFAAEARGIDPAAPVRVLGEELGDD